MWRFDGFADRRAPGGCTAGPQAPRGCLGFDVGDDFDMLNAAQVNCRPPDGVIGCIAIVRVRQNGCRGAATSYALGPGSRGPG